MLGAALSLWPIIKELLRGLGVIKSPEEEKAYQLKLIELAQREEEFFARQQEAVNATMQAEAKSEHWAQWLWRPMIGFTFAGVIINNYIMLPYFVSLGLKPLDIPEGIWSAMLVVLGVAAGTRGLEKWQKAK